MKLTQKYFIIAGAAGAGKSAAIARLGGHLSRQGLAVAVVSAALASASGNSLWPGLHIAGMEPPFRAFSCMFEAASSIGQEKPDVWLIEAEPTATDLIPTLGYPLRRLFGETLAPGGVSVLLDARSSPIDDASDEAKPLAAQLREAAFIILNKIESAPLHEVEDATRVCREAFPRSRVFEASIGHGVGLAKWFEALLESAPPSQEPLLTPLSPAWLNSTIELSCQSFFDGNTVSRDLSGILQTAVRERSGETPLIRLQLAPTDGLRGCQAQALLDRNGGLHFHQMLEEPIASGELTLHLKGCANRDILQDALTLGLRNLFAAHPKLFARIEHTEFFPVS